MRSQSEDMLKQSKVIYKNVINRIAVALIVNAVLLVALSNVTAIFEYLFTQVFASGSDITDAIFRIIDCVVYFASFTLPILVFSYMQKQGESEIYTPRPKPVNRFSGLECAAAIGLSLGVILFSSYVNYFVVNSFSSYSDFTSETFWAVELDKPYQIVIYAINIAVVPAVCEELLFRGTICKALMPYGRGTAIVISALLFSLMHTNIEQTIYTFVAGVLLAWIYVKTDSIIYPMLLHFINNATSVLSTVAYEKLSEDTAIIVSYTVEEIIFALSVLSALYLVLKHKKARKKAVEEATTDEDETVLPLGTGEKVGGFFSVGMIIYIAYCVLKMAYYLYISYQ